MSISFSTYNGYFVFHLHPYWKQDVSGQNMRDINTLVITGYSFSETYQDYPRARIKLSILVNTTVNISDVNDVFDALYGRMGNIWFPSWNEDIVVTSNIGAADVTINVQDIDYVTYYPTLPGTGRHLFFYVNQNTWFAREVTSVPSSTELTIDSALGQIVKTTKLRTSFLYFGRFDIDTIEWKYVTKTIATADLYFIECPKEYP